MSREWRFFLDDMILCCEKITKFVGTFTLEEFLEDALVYDAVFRNLEILGEAAKHIPAEVKAMMPDLAWREIIGMRDRIAHGYFTIKTDVIWNAIKVEVPLLLSTLQAFKKENPS